MRYRPHAKQRFVGKAIVVGIALARHRHGEVFFYCGKWTSERSLTSVVTRLLDGFINQLRAESVGVNH